MSATTILHEMLPPVDVEDARNRRIQLIQEAEDIQYQLQHQSLERFLSEGKTESAYTRWRRDAGFAMNRKRQEARMLKDWISRQTNPKQYQGKRINDAEDVIFANQFLQEVHSLLVKTDGLSDLNITMRIKRHLKRSGIKV